MTKAEMREVSIRFQTQPDIMLRLITMHPNQVAELAANELLVREIKKNKIEEFLQADA